MEGDNPWHTDLLLAMGFDLRDDYGTDHTAEQQNRKRAVYNVVCKVQSRWRRGGGLAVKAWINGSEDAEAPTTPNGCMVLCGSGVVEGLAVHPMPDDEDGVPPGSIVIVAHADAEHYIAAVTAHKGGGGAVVCESGGRLSHLAVEGLESGFRVVVVPNARQKFPAGSRVRVDIGAGRVEVVR